jgi:hypothetical protein
MSLPESPFPTDARGLLILVGLLPVGLILFMLAKFTGTWWAWVLFMGFLVGMLIWAYRRARGEDRPSC